MPAYVRSSSNFKTAAKRVLLPEFISPLLILILSGTFVAIWGFLFPLTWDQLLDSIRTAESFIIVPVVLSLFAILDFLLAFLLLLSISKLSYKTGLFWVILDLVLVLVLPLCFLLCPFVGRHLHEPVYHTWAWVLGSCLICLIFKLYRIRIVFFLLSELKEESGIWKRKLQSPYIYE